MAASGYRTSLADPIRFPSDEIVDLYSHRWEIELGFRERKQTLLDSSYTLRSKKPGRKEPLSKALL